MSVLIKGMEMPPNCYDCPFIELQEDEKAFCLAGLFEMFGIYTQQRYYICPLVEVPTPHGRLIDADELFGEYCEIAIAPYLYAPTVIESDE